MKAAEEQEEHYCLAIFIDIQGAFDHLWWPMLYKELRRRRCPSNVYQLLKSYSTKRYIRMYSTTRFVGKAVTRGCPQGSVLGPKMWNLIMDTNLQAMDMEGCSTIAFADDQVLILRGNSRRELEVIGNRAMQKVQEWAELNKLTVSQSKTKMMMLKNSFDVERPPRIQLKGNQIQMVQEFKYLGVTFTEGLRIQRHIEDIIKKARNVFEKALRIAGSGWGLRPRNLRTLYKGVFESIVTYAAPVLDAKLSNRMRELINRVQRQALLRVVKAYRTVSRDALPVIAGVLPADLLIKRAALNYNLRHRIPFQVGEFVYDEDYYGAEDYDSKNEELKITGCLLEDWQYQWETSTKGRDTYKFYPDVTKRYWAKEASPGHIVTQFLTGHGNFKDKLAYFKLSEDNLCPCGEPEDVWHMVYHCDYYSSSRSKFRRDIGMVNLPAPEALVDPKLFYRFSNFVIELYYQRIAMYAR